MEIHQAARKHSREQRIGEEDILFVTRNPLCRRWLGDDPQRELRLGLDTKMRWLEAVVLTSDDGREMAIHCMKMQRKYRKYLREDGLI